MPKNCNSERVTCIYDCYALVMTDLIFLAWKCRVHYALENIGFNNRGNFRSVKSSENSQKPLHPFFYFALNSNIHSGRPCTNHVDN